MGLLVVIVTPIFPLSFDNTSAFLFVPSSSLAKIGLLSSLLELFEFSSSAVCVADDASEPALVSSSFNEGADVLFSTPSSWLSSPLFRLSSSVSICCLSVWRSFFLGPRLLGAFSKRWERSNKSIRRLSRIFSSGSHVLCFWSQSFHLTKYSTVP